MKRVILILGFCLALLVSCQKEEETIIQDTTQSFLKSDPLAQLLSRASQNSTASDNILDNTSCFSVQLPVTVIVNSQQIIVTNQSDYQIVQDAIDEFSTDDDIVNFIFPITIKFKNHQTLIVQNSNQLDDVLDDCDEDDEFDEIDCISLIYPITINVYDSNNQIANTVTITSNTNFYNFLENLNDSTLIGIVYPIEGINSNNQTIVINSNAELENFIDDAIDDCDDSSSGGGTDLVFLDVIASGTWIISYFQEDDDNETATYNGYNFTFASNGNLTAVKNSVTINGTWDEYLDSGQRKLQLTFTNGDDDFDELEEDWRIIEFSATVIRLKHISGGDGSSDYLTFTKN
jgi:hypothetical protein